MNNEKIQNLVSNYCIFQYKWLNTCNMEIKPKKFYKLYGRNVIEIIDINLTSTYFKIITYKRLVFANEYNIQELTSTQIMNYINQDCDDDSHCDGDSHCEGHSNYDKGIIAKYTIKICENNDIITLMDEKYNLLQPGDIIKGITVRDILENVISV